MHSRCTMYIVHMPNAECSSSFVLRHDNMHLLGCAYVTWRNVFVGTRCQIFLLQKILFNSTPYATHETDKLFAPICLFDYIAKRCAALLGNVRHSFKIGKHYKRKLSMVDFALWIYEPTTQSSYCPSLDTRCSTNRIRK